RAASPLEGQAPILEGQKRPPVPGRFQGIAFGSDRGCVAEAPHHLNRCGPASSLVSRTVQRSAEWRSEAFLLQAVSGCGERAWEDDYGLRKVHRAVPGLHPGRSDPGLALRPPAIHT